MLGNNSSQASQKPVGPSRSQARLGVPPNWRNHNTAFDGQRTEMTKTTWAASKTMTNKRRIRSRGVNAQVFNIQALLLVKAIAMFDACA